MNEFTNENQTRSGRSTNFFKLIAIFSCIMNFTSCAGPSRNGRSEWFSETISTENGQTMRNNIRGLNFTGNGSFVFNPIQTSSNTVSSFGQPGNSRSTSSTSFSTISGPDMTFTQRTYSSQASGESLKGQEDSSAKRFLKKRIDKLELKIANLTAELDGYKREYAAMVQED